MKKYSIIILLLALAVTLSAQDTRIPQEVQNAFAILYPNVSNVKWGKEGSNEFEAEFSLNGVRTSVVFDKGGEVEETETQIEMIELPETVAPFIVKNYPGYKITEAEKIVDDKGVVTYEAEISKGERKNDLLFDKGGYHLEKKVDRDEENGEEDEN
ncbi:MAG: hypothetical protein WAN36_09340 [Calditrichia bacterium]